MKSFFRLTLLFVLLGILAGRILASPPQSDPLPPTSEELQHVVIISIDGLRPDALELAYTPNVDQLMANGAYRATAQTVNISRTLPGHASMLSGMIPEKHGLLWGLPYIGWPGLHGPTLFNVAHDAGLSTAMVYGKKKLDWLVSPNAVDKVFGDNVHDPEITHQAVSFIEAGLPNVLFIHYPDVDRVGHDYGWMSPNQLHAVTFVDGEIGKIISALEHGKYMNSTLLIITADHGGHDRRHGDDAPEDRTIPWLVAGPHVSSGVTIGSHVNIYDTAATAAHALGLNIPHQWDGQPILEIFHAKPDLVTNSPESD